MAAADTQPELQHHISRDSLHTGARLLRTTSNLFTGGADGLHAPNDTLPGDSPPTENTPLSAANAQSQPSLAQSQPSLGRQRSYVEMERTGPMSDQEAWATMMEEAHNIVTQNMRYIILLGLCLVLLVFIMIACGVLALVAVINYHDKPCDVPLKYYLLVTLLWSQVPGMIRNEIVGDPRQSSWSHQAQATLQIVLALPGLCVICWGFHMVSTADTCPKTNPNLFYPTRRYIYVQALFIVSTLTCLAVGALGGYYWIMRTLNRLMQGPGCTETVRNDLEKVEPGDKRLIADDGKIMGCPICMSKLSGSEKHGIIVATPCQHYFHQECLEEWCQNHLSCPMCRQPVGKPERRGEV